MALQRMVASQTSMMARLRIKLRSLKAKISTAEMLEPVERLNPAAPYRKWPLFENPPVNAAIEEKVKVPTATRSHEQTNTNSFSLSHRPSLKRSKRHQNHSQSPRKQTKLSLRDAVKPASVTARYHAPKPFRLACDGRTASI